MHEDKNVWNSQLEIFNTCIEFGLFFAPLVFLSKRFIITHIVRFAIKGSWVLVLHFINFAICAALMLWILVASGKLFFFFFGMYLVCCSHTLHCVHSVMYCYLSHCDCKILKDKGDRKGEWMTEWYKFTVFPICRYQINYEPEDY